MTIAQVSKQFDLTPDTLRYYERIGLIPPVPRNRSGVRSYGESDIRWVEFIRCMRASGLPIEVLIEYVGLFQLGDSTAAARKDLLKEQRAALAARITEMQATLERLDSKIASYEQTLLQKEHALIETEETK